MEKLRQYWTSLHAETASDLGAVCHPTKPALYNRFLDRIFAEAWRDAISPLAIRRSLEVGCGRGRWVKSLCDRGVNARGIDLAPAARPTAVARAEAIPFRSGSFDFVYAITVLQHLHDKKGALDEMNRELAPGGQMLVIELLDRAGVEWQEHVIPKSADWWRAEFAHRRLEITLEEDVEYLPIVQWVERKAARRGFAEPARAREGSAGSEGGSGWKKIAKKFAWYPITFASMALEPFAPALGTTATHRLFLAKKAAG